MTVKIDAFYFLRKWGCGQGEGTLCGAKGSSLKSGTTGGKAGSEGFAEAQIGIIVLPLL